MIEDYNIMDEDYNTKEDKDNNIIDKDYKMIDKGQALRARTVHDGAGIKYKLMCVMVYF
jgi:DNA-directed RNA polymerase subunit E'/Rpb7